MKTTFERVRAVVASHFGLNEDQISLTTSLKEELRPDSLDLVELAMELEEEFDDQIEFEDAFLEAELTVGEIVKWVDDLLPPFQP